MRRTTPGFFTSTARRIALVAALSAGSLARAEAQTPQRVDALLASDSLVEAARAADALLADGASSSAQRAQVAALFGRFTAADNADAARELGPGTAAAIMRLAAGTVPDALPDVEASLATRTASRGAQRTITELGFHLVGSGPALRAGTDDAGMALLVLVAARDTVAARAAIAAIDSVRAGMALRNLPPPLSLAEAELALGDSAAALARLLSFDSTWTRMERGVSWGAARNGWLLGRTWLLLGDVAAAMHHAGDARRAYQRVVALWANGDRDVQGAVARARLMMNGASPAPVAPAPVLLAAGATQEESRVRYDAVLWMQPRAIGTGEGRPLARLGFVARERVTRQAGAWSATQDYDSVTIDAPLLSALGTDGMAIRRGIQSAAGRLSATTACDSTGRLTSRSVDTNADLPGELRGLLERGAGFGPLALAIRLPGTAVRAGDTWTDTMTVDVPGADAPAVMRVTYRLTRLSAAGGRTLAFIAIDAATAAAAPVRATLTGEVVRDVEAGANVRLAASLRARLTNGATETPVRVLLTALREPVAGPATLAMR